MIKANVTKEITMTIRLDGAPIFYDTVDGFYNQFHNLNRQWPAQPAAALLDLVQQAIKAGNYEVERIEHLVDWLPTDRAAHEELVREDNEREETEQHAVKAIAETLGIKRCIWSYDAPALIANNLFAQGRVMFEYEGGWDDEFEIVDGPYDDPTFQDLFRAADRCLMRSQDGHHVFIEGARRHREEAGVTTYRLSYGS